MASKPVRCAGGCGRTQSMTVEDKVPDKAAFTVAVKWTCPECRDKQHKHEEAMKPKVAPAALAASVPQQAESPKPVALGGGSA